MGNSSSFASTSEYSEPLRSGWEPDLLKSGSHAKLLDDAYINSLFKEKPKTAIESYFSLTQEDEDALKKLAENFEVHSS